MAMSDVRDRCAIVGVGTNDYANSGESLELATLVEALRNALDDAGLTRTDLDGLIIRTALQEASMDNLPAMIGLPNINYAFQTWMHGRMNAMLVQTAALAVFAGMARYVACISTTNTSWFRNRFHTANSGVDYESLREGGGPHLEAPHYGNTSPPGGAAMAMQKYLLKYGYSPEDLAAVSVAQRAWAQWNPNALLRGKQLTRAGYLESPYVIEPLRLYDLAFPANVASCVIVGDAKEAKNLLQRPVLISGMQGSRSNRDVFVFGRSNLGVAHQEDRPYTAPEDMPLYRMAGIGRDEIQILGIFDTTSPAVPFGLEEFGFCGEGEALAWLNDGHSAPGGSLPINTHGGSLSEAMTGGNGAIIELVRQLRGDADERQVKDVEVGQYLSADRSSLILRS